MQSSVVIAIYEFSFLQIRHDRRKVCAHVHVPEYYNLLGKLDEMTMPCIE